MAANYQVEVALRQQELKAGPQIIPNGPGRPHTVIEISRHRFKCVIYLSGNSHNFFHPRIRAQSLEQIAVIQGYAAPAAIGVGYQNEGLSCQLPSGSFGCGHFSTISIFGRGKINFPPWARYAFSLSRNSARKCQGSTR